MKQYDVGYVRSQFPSLSRTVGGRPAAYLDGPGGSQVPQRVIDAMTRYLSTCNCNYHGFFDTSRETDAMMTGAHEALADFLGCSPDEVSFGANMSTMTLLLSQALRREMQPGDEIIVTALDHDANRSSWTQLEEHGIVIREVPVKLDDCTLDWDAFEALVNDRTRLIACGYASNAVGTINDVARACALARKAGAFSFVDAVHYALHGPIDVRAIDCDFLLCSAYKFFGPHIGVQYTRKEVGDRLRPLRLSVREVEDMPYKFETGTLNNEGIAGAAEAVEFIADLGRHHMELVADKVSHLTGRRRDVIAGMLAIEEHEKPLCTRLMEGLAAVEGVTIYGSPADAPRTSTVSFTLEGWTAAQIAEQMGDVGLFVWDGDFFAIRLLELLDLDRYGGLLRVGLAPYNTVDEVDRVIARVAELARLEAPAPV